MGVRYDEHLCGQVLTHAKAYTVHVGTELVAVCDLQRSVSLDCARRLGVKAYFNVREMLADLRPDIVSICTPDDTHIEMLRLCAEHGVKTVWCEKPIGTDVKEAQKVLRECKKRDMVVAVNYIRRWMPEIKDVGIQLSSGQLGDVKRITINYSKGFLHAGSHYIDLLVSWFGFPKSWQVLGVFSENGLRESTIDVMLTFQKGITALLLGAHDRFYSLDEIDIVAQKARIKIENYSRSIAYFMPIKSGLSGGRIIPLKPTRKAICFDRLMLAILDDILEARNHGRQPVSSGWTALDTLRICTDVIASSHSRRR